MRAWLLRVLRKMPSLSWSERHHYLRDDNDIEGPRKAPGYALAGIGIIGVMALIAFLWCERIEWGGLR